MKVGDTYYRTIWPSEDGSGVSIIDQTRLPHEFVVSTFHNVDGAVSAIRDMLVRGAPLIGATAAYGLVLAMLDDPSDANLDSASAALLAARPTAVNLRWAVEKIGAVLGDAAEDDRAELAKLLAAQICDDDVSICSAIGDHGLKIIEGIAAPRDPDAPVNILTHCNAGWLATVDWGTAISPIYKAHDAGINVHVWVDETRPRNQGAHLTAWELASHGVPHTLIVDNAGGYLMQSGLVDLCIVGTDRTTSSGDVCNKIGTYLKALAANDNGIPFYVAAPSPSIDWSISDGLREIPIEQRDGGEVTDIYGSDVTGSYRTVRITPRDTPARNDAFDITPARLVSGLITERGVCEANTEAMAELFPDLAKAVGTL